MKSLVKSCLAFLLLAHAADAFAQPVVGRVLVAAGQVTLVRQGTPRAAIAATGLQVGDAVVTSAASNAQIGFVDHSVVALRESSHFLVERFQFQPEGGSNALAFSLLKGGLRTVTGLIGVSRRADEYRVKTPIASVGIRGTQYSLVYCQDDCADPEGVLAANGAYGGVYDGTVAVSNNAGEVEFGRDEYFYVADINTIPQPLLGPPSFLGDRLKGMAKNAPKPAAEPAARSADGAASASQEAEAALPPTAAYVATETRGPGGAPIVVGGALAAGPSSTAFAFAHSLIETNGGPASYGGALAISAGPGQPTNLLTLSGSGPSQTLAGFNFNPAFPRSGSVGSSGIDMQGFDAASGVHWGRWVNGTIAVGEADEFLAPGTQTPPSGVHYLYGIATPDSVLASKTGTFTFSDFGGTTPTDSNGQIATSSAFGAMSVNFTARTANLSSLNISFPNATWSYSGIPFTMGFGAGITTHLGAFTQGAGSCIGAGCGASQGPGNATIDTTGVFIGSSANFLGISFQGFSQAPTSNNRVAWGAVRIYRCPTCP